MLKGQVVSGDFGKIIIRQKSTENIEIGELLIGGTKEGLILMQIYDLHFSSQVSQQNLELISGMRLEGNEELKWMEPELRNYTIAIAKPLLTITQDNAKLSKTLPVFFSEAREVVKEDLHFLEKPENPIYFGDLRSGSRKIDVPINLKGDSVLSHHILVAATTGRGKSNLTSVILWKLLDSDYAGVLVLDPHDEYYGRNSQGLKDHPNKKKVRYYTARNPPPGQGTLKINLKNLKPGHMSFLSFSDAQHQAMNAYYREYGNKWIESVVLEKPLNIDFNPATVNVLKRKLLSLLDLKFSDNQLFCNGIFDISSGEATIKEICSSLEEGNMVIVDTSEFSGESELLIGNMITSEIFARYKHYKLKGNLKEKPVISVVLEEAPRVLGKEVLEKGPNIFSTIAREGRKFKVGLYAITQLPSLIPKDILANMNTKIILGIEMSNERQAIIDSSAQDLSSDSRSIASLDKGEAIITSNFARFAIPVKIPLFSDVIKDTQNEHVKETYRKKEFSDIEKEVFEKKKVTDSFAGINLG
ncbi:MAG: ATP-binding protein [Candidatus Woesearchaeota archaeon]